MSCSKRKPSETTDLSDLEQCDLFCLLVKAASLVTHFALVPGFSVFAAAGCNVLILGPDLRDDFVHVEDTRVVHLHDHRGLLQAFLHPTQLLLNKEINISKTAQTVTFRQRKSSIEKTLNVFFAFNMMNDYLLNRRKPCRSWTHRGLKILCLLAPPLTDSLCPHPAGNQWRIFWRWVNSVIHVKIHVECVAAFSLWSYLVICPQRKFKFW